MWIVIVFLECKVGGHRTDPEGMCHKCSVRIEGTERTLQPVSSRYSDACRSVISAWSGVHKL